MVRSHPLEPQPYTGMTAIVSGEIAEDLTNYLAESEQVGWGAGGLGLGCTLGWLGWLGWLQGCRMHCRCRCRQRSCWWWPSRLGPAVPAAQVNSAVALGVSINRDCSVKSAGGFMVQVRAPGAQ